MKKQFKVPKCIPLVHGDKRIKIKNKGNMLLWYRRDFGSPIISNLQYEQPVKCVAIINEYGWAQGLLLYIPPSEGFITKADRKDQSNYAISMGGGKMIKWVDGKPFTFDIADHPSIGEGAPEKVYQIVEEFNSVLTK